MMEVASLAGRHALELMVLTLLIGECIAYGAFRIGRARVLTFGAGIGLGVVVIAAATAAFATITHVLLTNPVLTHFDLAFALELGASVPRDVKHFFAAATHVGDPWVLAVCCAAGVMALLWKRHTLLACALAAASGGNGLLNMTLKQLIRRARPEYDTALASVHSWSFPSGHTSGSLATFGALAYVLIRTLPARWRLPVVLGAVAVIGTIAWSRLMIGVHFASDVLAGALSSTAWLTACVLAAEYLRRRTISQ
ncbi:phosphatase PAP2 family protein [Burkholderia sp. Ac-20365]|jgi:undecaprenyl-diphosphatase|uniref:phosphatase PAP2 family protein n=1 Tax=Burkholderia sp. Ac-20365 TaxID=2703897 RepID=UPI00197BE86D|nr:phosphatase PAP2 family protein [Burkholderia sp. Ac-20365]MBN3766945.1 phosphatase PAP2 family protein [Burkholderia sp. Ac-20365]